LTATGPTFSRRNVADPDQHSIPALKCGSGFSYLKISTKSSNLLGLAKFQRKIFIFKYGMFFLLHHYLHTIQFANGLKYSQVEKA
jgi:hypothetical protein